MLTPSAQNVSVIFSSVFLDIGIASFDIPTNRPLFILGNNIDNMSKDTEMMMNDGVVILDPTSLISYKNV